MSVTLVVFSKDRALQCDSLLRSIKDQCTGIGRVLVIAKVTSTLHENAYWKLANDDHAPFHELRIELAESCGAILTQELGRHAANHIAFAVDDQLFYAPSDYKKAAFALDAHQGFTWSWRLGPQEPSTKCLCFDGEMHWLCSALDSDPDYGYLFHLDGALYRTIDFVRMLDRFLPDWKTGDYIPNDLEAAVAGNKRLWAASVGPHLGPPRATCITWQVNRVQTSYGSPVAEIPETDLDALATAYLAGKKVDNEGLYMDRSWTTSFNPPGTRPTHVFASEEASRFWASFVK